MTDLLGLLGNTSDYKGNWKMHELSIYPNDSFFRKVAETSEKFISISKDHLHAYISVGPFMEEWPDLNIFIWEKQRPVNNATVDEITSYLDNKINNGCRTRLAVNQIVTIATVNMQDPRIIDGQHRIWALSHMDADTPFLLQCVNFTNNDERFFEFVKINSNTPLPDYFKAITTRDEYYKLVSNNYADAFSERYPHLISKERPNVKTSYLTPYGYVTITQIKTLIYAYLQKRQPDMEVDMNTNVFMSVLEDTTIFKKYEASYPLPIINHAICLGGKTKDETHIQCTTDPKANGYCGRHKTMKTPYNPRAARTMKFKEIESSGAAGFFILDPNWLVKTMDVLYPLITGI